MTEINLTHDGAIDVALGQGRKDMRWKNGKLNWSVILNRFRTTHRTAETIEQYLAMDKDRQDEIKDVGGFVGGYLVGGRRLKRSVLHRQLLALDIDFGTPETWTRFKELYKCAALIHSTHKHTPASPRYRLLIPVSRELFPDEYEAVARRIAGDINIELFDPTTFQPERLMYWPSTAANGVYEFDCIDAPWVDADAVLNRYVNWRDLSEWPVSVKQGAEIKRTAEKAGDPLEKTGLVGAFCRTYTIDEVIATFLSDVYTPVEGEPNRYTYERGSTAKGAIVYDEKFLYSHHSTDPAHGLHNAFDLVRIHLYGLQDEDYKGDAGPTSLPSYKAMLDLCVGDPKVKATLGRERINNAMNDFSGIGPDTPKQDAELNSVMGLLGIGDEPLCVHDYDIDLSLPADEVPGPFIDLSLPEHVEPKPEAVGDATTAVTLPLTHDLKPLRTELPPYQPDWLEKMEVDKRGTYLNTARNISLIMRYDDTLRGAFGYDLFNHREVVLKACLPSRSIPRAMFVDDIDMADIRAYIETVYGIANVGKIDDAVALAARGQSFHPVQEYLLNIKWDGVRRAERIFIDYLGAENSEYTRTVTRKWLTAAVKRIMEPGCKFDNVVVLAGPQGTGKSTILSKLGSEWFSDSFLSVHGRESCEQIEGVWIMEVGELAGLKKAEVQAIKHYFAKQKDTYRPAYGKKMVTLYRTVVFAGTTNEDTFLSDDTGERRFWPIRIAEQEPYYSIWEDLTADVVRQIWAEAVIMYCAGERLHLTSEQAKQATEKQTAFKVVDGRAEALFEWLQKPVCENWRELLPHERAAYMDDDPTTPEGDTPRDFVGVHEIWCEFLRAPLRDMNKYNTKEVHSLMRNIPGWERSRSSVRMTPYGFVKGYRKLTEQKNKSV